MPLYDFTQDNRAPHTVAVHSAPVIVIEGLFALFDAELCKSMSLKIFVDTAADVRFIRRLQRDMAERGRSAESVIHQYLESVRPMHKQFIEPSKRDADVILPHGANGPAVDMITTKMMAHTSAVCRQALSPSLRCAQGAKRAASSRLTRASTASAQRALLSG